MEIGKAVDIVKEIRKDAYQDGYLTGYAKGVKDTLNTIDAVLGQKHDYSALKQPGTNMAKASHEQMNSLDINGSSV